ncbi:hypothetical protein DL763_004139 [Monosporascus cannonballus]|nr:hypothetical protein DL763_004139 [Monosporascus cannonballus]
METSPTPTRYLRSLFNHIALPAKLPQRQDADLGGIQSALVDRLIDACKIMRDSQQGSCRQVWDFLRISLQSCKTLNANYLVILHVDTQNAGIFIHKPTEPQFAGKILFEFFEASPRREAVLAAKTGALSWSFPGVAIHLPSSVLDDDDFLESFCMFLEQASVETTKKLSEYAVKAGAGLWESRETPDPSLITSLLAAILEANGTRISPTLLQKKVRDEVLWFDAEAPWRRLPYWLVLRVSISRYLAMMLGDGLSARFQYKVFMCLVHASMLSDIQQVVSLEDQEFLKAKLCRRLFKLDSDRSQQSQKAQAACDTLFATLSPLLNKVIKATATRIQTVWDQERLKTTKPILPLPIRASPQDLRLSLIASRQYLRDARKRFQGIRYPRSSFNAEAIVLNPSQHFHELAPDLFGLFKLEKRIRLACDSPVSGSQDLSRRCVALHAALLEYIDRVGSRYDGNTEQKSLMLLLIMEIWMAMDKIACTLFPLLLDYHPIFPPCLLEVFHLSALTDLARARKVQRYLRTRESLCRSTRMTIFDDPVKGCFGERYFNESSDAGTLAAMLSEIQETAEEDRKLKEGEWLKLSSEYEALTKEIDSTTCLNIIDGGFTLPRHDARNCPKCQLTRRRSRIRIRIFESPLPDSAIVAKVVVFELRCPKAFAAYRDATWSILYRLANDSQEKSIDPKCGPHDDADELLGTVHTIFRDPSFCTVLLQQLGEKLDAIFSNWRETYLMEIVMTLVMRVVTLTVPYHEMADITTRALDILARARAYTIQWVRELRQEIYTISDPDSARNCQIYMLWAALLCKRSFIIHLRVPDLCFDKDALAVLVECCIVAHDNIPKKIHELPGTLRNSIIRDFRMMHQLEDQIEEAIELYGHESMLTVLQSLSYGAELKQIRNLLLGADCWLHGSMDDVHHGKTQALAYNYLHGVLLIDGQPLGSAIVLSELFGTQNLTKYPSHLEGMSHTQIHAYTNGPVPDPLTGRSGAEEALSILSSGICQPWSPLGGYPLEILRSVAKLSPKREYYPEDMRSLSIKGYAEPFDKATLSDRLNLDAVEYHSFRPGQTPQLEPLVKLIDHFKVPAPEDPPLAEFASAKSRKKLLQARAAHAHQADADCKSLAELFLKQWPCEVPSLEGLDRTLLVDTKAAYNAVLPELQRLFYNYEFSLHLDQVQHILIKRQSEAQIRPPAVVQSESTFSKPQRHYELPRLSKDLMKIKARNSCLAAFERCDQPTSPSPVLPVVVKHDIHSLQQDVERHFNDIEFALGKPNASMSPVQVEWLKRGNLWPAVTRVTILEQLRSTSECKFGSGMKESIIEAALAITEFQRQIRLELYRQSKDTVRLEEERRNIGHSNWRPDQYPDWLLLEVESDLLIRETQVEVALAIIAPNSGECSVLQLNMGQGKTSCIIPMVASLLADGKNLVRVSVPKALLQQTAQLLHTRLGGLIGRNISHVPFSRRTPTKEDNIRLFQKLHRNIRDQHGILLTLPEHQLSFMLSGLQRVLDNRIPEAKMMVRVQKWLQSHARDILDESDHTLAVKTQLIYPSGSQMTVDGHPHRWLIAEHILHMVDMHLHDLAFNFPHSIEVVRRPEGGFPFVFFLRPDVEEELVSRLKRDICQGVRGIIPMESLDIADRLAIKEFLSGGKIRPTSIDRVRNLCPEKPHLRQIVYLLRGLLVHRILIMTLKKRYGVQYGIHPSRDPVAVPFHAKGVPSDQSEFGHVDVAILLTCLAFYHGGINLQQTRQALESVLKSDDPSSEYEKWLDHDNFPEYLRDWHSINVDDGQQLYQIWQFVRYKVVVIDYYMNKFVFPQHAKQFKVKLQSNGWDIPLFSSSEVNTAKKGPPTKIKRLTTGFSGTSDECANFPLTIKQDNLPSLAHTNAEVLTYLLQYRSRSYVVMEEDHKRLSEVSFLQVLKSHNIRVLIDAGAQILEMNNLELAETWLKLDGQARVALFFDGDRPYIVSKQGAKTPLLASPYADNLSEVLVYLDEAHTRGTDLKFGPQAKAALTLGLGQTKDSLVQAAMRLRQLGTTQGVTFFAPPEVNQSIRDICMKKDTEKVDSKDVDKPAATSGRLPRCKSLQPLFYAQGVDFCNRMQAAADFPDFLGDDEQRGAYVAAIRQTERQTLQQLYAPQTKVKAKPTGIRSNPQIAKFTRELENRRKEFQDSGQAVHASALQEVEQEREIEYEVEAVRQVKKPTAYTPHMFPGLHRDLETFARTGRMPAGASCFVHVLRSLARTSLGRKYKVNQGASSSQLFVSTEFEKTVKLVIESANDNFMRPVNWILYSPTPEAAVIITPEEAEIILPMVRKLNSATFLLTYAAPVTRRMLHFNNLKYYSIPSLPNAWAAPQWLTTELGFFAGRLYFEWSEYGSICRMLGIDESAPMLNESDTTEADTSDQLTDFATETSAQATTIPMTDGQGDSKNIKNPRHKSQYTGLTPKPFTFTQGYLAVRRRGQEISHTPMGFLCMGKPLHDNHAFFRRAETPKEKKGLVPMALAQADGGDEECHGEDMGVGEYDPSAVLQGNEEHEEIKYDESELYHEEDEVDAKSSEKARDRGGRR